jgi:hypothetical protein
MVSVPALANLAIRPFRSLCVEPSAEEPKALLIGRVHASAGYPGHQAGSPRPTCASTGDEMAADGDDSDAVDATGTYITLSIRGQRS